MKWLPIDNSGNVLVPPEVTVALANFRSVYPSKYINWLVDEIPSIPTILHQYGVMLVEDCDRSNKKRGWICLASEECRKNYVVKKLSNGTGNGVRHLSSIHSINFVSRAKRQRDDKYDKITGFVQGSDNKRIFELLTTQLIVCKNLPFNFVEYTEFQQLLGGVMKKQQETFSRIRLQHLIKEVYIHVTNQLRTELEPILQRKRSLCVNVDAWTNKPSLDKYIGVRVFFVNDLFEYKSMLLSVRHFNPPSSMRNPEGGIGLHECVKRWTLDVLAQYKIAPDHVFTSVTDYGKDVSNIALSTGWEWEWCPPHMLNRVVLTAFAQNQSSQTNANLLPSGAKDLLTRVNRTIRTVKDKSKLGDLFKEICGKGKCRYKILKSYQEQRFLGVFLTFQRILQLYSQVDEFFQRYGLAMSFPIQSDYERLREVTSVLKPLHRLSVVAQSSKSSTGYKTPLMLYIMATDGILRVETNKQITDCLDKSKKIELKDSVALEVQWSLMKGLAFRYFERFCVGSKASYIFEMQLFLHPQYSQLTGMEKLLDLTKPEYIGSTVFSFLKENNKTFLSFDELRNMIRQKVINIGVELMMGKSQDEQFQNTDDILSPSLEGCSIASEPDYGNCTNTTDGDDLRRYFEGIISAELTIFRAITVHNVPDPLKWWKQTSDTFPYLSKVVQVVYCASASAAAIEVDFGGARRMMTRNRSKTAGTMVDMCQTISRNKDRIALDSVQELTSEQIRASLPSGIETDYGFNSGMEEVTPASHMAGVEVDEGQLDDGVVFFDSHLEDMMSLNETAVIEMEIDDPISTMTL